VQDLFPTIVYLLCFFTSSACAWMLGRSYRRTGARLLLWSGLCFFFLAANNLVLVVDLVLLPGNDLRLGRLLFTLAALGTLLFGFVWDLEEER
jgi:hypothetical protein